MSVSEEGARRKKAMVTGERAPLSATTSKTSTSDTGTATAALTERAAGTSGRLILAYRPRAVALMSTSVALASTVTR